MATNALLLSVKIVLMSTGVLFLATLLTPHLFALLTSFNLSDFFTAVSSWLRPPYLYIVINAIIITIAASSRLYQNHHDHASSHSSSPSPHHDIAAAAASDRFRHRRSPVGVADDEPSYFATPHPSEIVDDDVRGYGAAVGGSGSSYDNSIFAKDVVDETTTAPMSYRMMTMLTDTPTVTATPISVGHPAVYDNIETTTFKDVAISSSYNEAVAPQLPPPEVVSNSLIGNNNRGEVVRSVSPLMRQQLDDEEDTPPVIRKSTRKATMPPPVPVAAPPPLPPLMRQESIEMFWSEMSEKPPASSRFGHNRRPARATADGGSGKALRRITKPKKNETLEHTWKTITEGRHMPLTRHLKKSDTWENQTRQQSDQSPSDMSSPPPPIAKKSATFQDRTNYSPIAPVNPSRPAPSHIATKLLRKEPSLGQDELNRRVEAFINKFNEDMRLQRQQSQQQFLEMINRAAY